MKKVKSIILRTAGTNCDIETAFALKRLGVKSIWYILMYSKRIKNF